ncbi:MULTISPECIES: hypothetical protein [Dyadobacter]|uniref:Uncharacterized protein n=1 Tax=Dyadobacter chenhuakuii TaxID=2909339 RepID=A0A9X1QCJ6_9BACT|nr:MULTISPECIES: hypothetical protein [Dyadobacter]MCF2498524.1 hypothetical protein [Dyadobacter chenhuakuii]MCF2516760.1 hypothetical protein [Dyadobacter sp. CY351]
MTKRIHLILALACIFEACTKKESESSSAKENTAQPVSECYAYATDKDSAFLHIEMTAENIVTGELEYSLFEKDKNRGKIEGKINGDTLLADYQFMSEGVESTREVVFLKKDGNWVEGFGPVDEKDGGMRFSDRSKLDFTNGLTFRNAKCR